MVKGGGPRVVVSTAAFHAKVRGSVPGLGGLKEKKMFLPHPHIKLSIVGSLRDREVACSASDRSNFESCVWRTVSSHSFHHPQEVLLTQFSPYVHTGGLKPDSFHLYNGQCCKELAGTETHIPDLSSNQEEADGRIMYHINDSVVKHGVQSVFVDSPDTDVFVILCLATKTLHNLQKLFVKLGRRKNKTIVPIVSFIILI